MGKLNEDLRKTRLKWLGHVFRRKEEYVGKRVGRLEMGTQMNGRPKRRWKGCINRT